MEISDIRFFSGQYERVDSITVNYNTFRDVFGYFNGTIF